MLINLIIKYIFKNKKLIIYKIMDDQLLNEESEEPEKFEIRQWRMKIVYFMKPEFKIEDMLSDYYGKFVVLNAVNECNAMGYMEFRKELNSETGKNMKYTLNITRSIRMPLSAVLKSVDGVILFFDFGDKDSFKFIQERITSCKDDLENMKTYVSILGINYVEPEKCEVNPEEARKLAKECGIEYKEFSSETKAKEIVEGTIEAIYNHWGTKFAPTKVLKKKFLPRIYNMVDDDDDDDNNHDNKGNYLKNSGKNVIEAEKGKDLTEPETKEEESKSNEKKDLNKKSHGCCCWD